MTDATRELLKKPTFDIWQWEDSEMLYLLQQMFVDLKLVERLYIEVITDTGIYFVKLLLQFITASECVIFERMLCTYRL